MLPYDLMRGGYPPYHHYHPHNYGHRPPPPPGPPTYLHLDLPHHDHRAHMGPAQTVPNMDHMERLRQLQRASSFGSTDSEQDPVTGR